MGLLQEREVPDSFKGRVDVDYDESGDRLLGDGQFTPSREVSSLVSGEGTVPLVSQDEALPSGAAGDGQDRWVDHGERVVYVNTLKPRQFSQMLRGIRRF